VVTANYQDYLEQQWIKELRAKYPYDVNEEVLSSIK
jgi:peptidyl-prolyl cis-trans isomerase SurA